MGKMMSPNETIWWMPENQAANIEDVLKVSNFTDPGAKAVDISCAIATGYKLGATASDTNDESTICDPVNVKNLTRHNFEASLTFFREELGDKDAAGNETVLDKAFQLFKGMGCPKGWLIHRVGKLQGTPAKAGQEVSVYAVQADLAQFVAPDAGGTIKYTVEFVPRGPFELDARLVA